MQSILETWQSEEHTPDAQAVEAMRLDTARELGGRASCANAEWGSWRSLDATEARADLRQLVEGREPSEDEVAAYLDGWMSEAPDGVTLAGGAVWQRDASGSWSRVLS